MNLRSLFFGLLFSVLSLRALALEMSVAPQGRSYPLSAAVEATAKHEFVIWDQRTEGSIWKMGLIQPKVIVGSQGLMEAGVSLFPVGFLELGFAHAVTHRFYYKVRPFDKHECDTEICEGAVTREKLTARLGLAFGDWVVQPTYQMVRLHHGDNSKPLADESENILAAPGGDTLDAYSVVLGHKNGPTLIGLYGRQARFRDSEKKNEAQYVIARLKLEEKTYGLGVGRYASDYSQPGFSVYATMVWTWGQSLALF